MRFGYRTGVGALALLAAALIGGATTYVVQGASGSRTAMMDRPGGDDMSTDMGMGRFTDDQPFDAQFLDQMVVHHEGAIMSTRAMIADSTRPELSALAEEILTSQRQQLAQMRTWRDEWYPDLEPTFRMGGSMMGGSMMDGSMMDRSMMGGSMMGGSMMDASMGVVDAAIETMYLRMMIVHHQLGVDMAEQAQQEAEHPELKELAAVVAQEQGAQIAEMRAYLAASPEVAG